MSSNLQNIDTKVNVKSTFNIKNVHEPQLLYLGKLPMDNLSPMSPINSDILKQKKEMEGRWEGSEKWDLGGFHKNGFEQQEIPKFSVSQNYIVCALKHKFIILEQKISDSPTLNNEFSPISTPISSPSDNIDLNYYNPVATGGESGKNDYITSVLCLPVLKSVQLSKNINQHKKSNMFVLVGYHSGFFKIYSITGKLILSYWLHNAPLIKIKIRSIGSQLYGPPDNDELILLYEDKIAVIIDGLNLWYTLRSRTSIDGEKIDNMEGSLPTLSYRKWEFNHQDNITDIISLGPANETESYPAEMTFSYEQKTTSSISRFIAVGSKPIITYYAASENDETESITSFMAKKVTSTMFSFAKSIWGSNHEVSPTNNSSPQKSKRMSISSSNDYSPIQSSSNTLEQANASATNIPAILFLSTDQDRNANNKISKMNSRRILSIIPSPPSPTTGKSTLAALTDSYGRVILLDLETCTIIRMWKGMRDAQCGWIESEINGDDEDLTKNQEFREKLASAQLLTESFENLNNSNVKSNTLKDALPASSSNSSLNTKSKTRKRPVLFLAIYIARGILEIYHMRHGKRVAQFQVGTNQHLITSIYGIFGSSEAIQNKASNIISDLEKPSCYLISQTTGEINKIIIPASCVVSDSLKIFICTLTRKYQLLDESKRTRDHPYIQDIKMLIKDINGVTPKLDIFKCFSDKTPYLVQLDILEEIRKSSGIEEFVDPLIYIKEHQDEVNTVEFKAKCQLLFQESLLRKYQILIDWECNEEDNESSRELNAFIEDTKTHFPEFFESNETDESKEDDNSEKNAICGPQAFLNSFKYILSSQNEMKFILHSNLSNQELVKLATSLYSPLLKYPKCGQSWLKDIYSFFKLSLAEWINLFILWYDTLTDNNASPTFKYKINSLISIFSVIKYYCNSGNISSLLQFIKNSQKPGLVLLLSFILRQFTKDIQNEVVENCITRLIDIKFLESHIEKEIFNDIKFHKNLIISTQIPRLIAKQQVYVFSHENANKNYSQQLMEKFNPNPVLILQFTTIELIKEWNNSRDNIEFLQHIKFFVKSIKDQAQKNALIIYIWIRYLSLVLQSIHQIVDRSRKAPKDKILSRSLNMDSNVIKKFLKECHTILSEIVLEDSKLSIKFIIHQIINNKWDDFDDPKLNEWIITCGEETINKQFISDHLLLIKILQLIFEFDYKFVRPSRFFTLDTPLCGSIFMTIPYHNSLIDIKVMSERREFVIRTLEYDLEKAHEIGKELNIEAEVINRNYIMHLYETRRDEEAKTALDCCNDKAALGELLLLYIKHQLNTLIKLNPNQSLIQIFNSGLKKDTLEWILNDKTISKYRMEIINIKEILNRYLSILFTIRELPVSINSSQIVNDCINSIEITIKSEEKE
ncbi:hypothetical protein BCR36DRAFT_328764 [Piromyces finnis]|uniref:Rab3-GAP regulatory subunit N-terminal domain-containing protein n=1 Tax=Piromyces finnis TaxID=1754191 RepID=A0A1Y1V884_9FUNG|nr:hypothetical protein BCR36DRAFT_328764 [Piromyces finnis]|eukprot:ORX48964.1 hypothetical protein BCR36DRAFT_328764 [Piromyces finnis]